MVFDRADGNSKTVRDLGISQFIDPVEQEDFARSWGEAPNRVAIPAVQIVCLEPLFLSGFYSGQRCLVQWDEIRWPAARPSRSIGDEVPDDAVKIGFGRLLDVVVTQRSQSLECVLYDVSRLIWVTHVPAYPARGARTLAFEQVRQPGPCGRRLSFYVVSHLLATRKVATSVPCAREKTFRLETVAEQRQPTTRNSRVV